MGSRLCPSVLGRKERLNLELALNSSRKTRKGRKERSIFTPPTGNPEEPKKDMRVRISTGDFFRGILWVYLIQN